MQRQDRAERCWARVRVLRGPVPGGAGCFNRCAHLFYSRGATRLTSHTVTDRPKKFRNVCLRVWAFSEEHRKEIDCTSEGCAEKRLLPEGRKLPHPVFGSVVVYCARSLRPEEVEETSVRQRSPQELDQFQALSTRSARAQ